MEQPTCEKLSAARVQRGQGHPLQRTSGNYCSRLLKPITLMLQKKYRSFVEAYHTVEVPQTIRLSLHKRSENRVHSDITDQGRNTHAARDLADDAQRQAITRPALFLETGGPNPPDPPASASRQRPKRRPTFARRAGLSCRARRSAPSHAT